MHYMCIHMKEYMLCMYGLCNDSWHSLFVLLIFAVLASNAIFSFNNHFPWYLSFDTVFIVDIRAIPT